MSKLCFGTYGMTLIDLNAIAAPTNPKIVQLLLGLIIDNEKITDRNGQTYVVTDKIAGELLSRNAQVNKKILVAATSQKIIDAAQDYFDDVVIAAIIPIRLADVVEKISELLSSDDTISATTKVYILSLKNQTEKASFLSQAFLYALSVKNKKEFDTPTIDFEAAEEIGSTEVEQIGTLLRARPRPEELSVPAEPIKEEMKYIEELLLAYTQKLGFPVANKSDLPEQYATDLALRRKEFYSAESIRHATRDVFPNATEDQFEILKEETLSGIIDVYSGTFANGYERLLSVMRHATTITINRCLFSRTDWIGNSQKKGVCHILVNDGKIRWFVE